MKEEIIRTDGPACPRPTPRAEQLRTGLAWLRAADPVLAQVIDDHPDFDPDAWIRRLPAMDLFGALVFQVIGQQISVIAATAIFARLTDRFGGRVPDAVATLRRVPR